MRDGPLDVPEEFVDEEMPYATGAPIFHGPEAVTNNFYRDERQFQYNNDSRTVEMHQHGLSGEQVQAVIAQTAALTDAAVKSQAQHALGEVIRKLRGI